MIAYEQDPGQLLFMSIVNIILNKIIFDQIIMVFWRNNVCENRWSFPHKNISLLFFTPVQDTKRVLGFYYFFIVILQMSVTDFLSKRHWTRCQESSSNTCFGDILFSKWKKKQTHKNPTLQIQKHFYYNFELILSFIWKGLSCNLYNHSLS